MSAVHPLRRLRAIALNGLVWGGAWFVGVMLMVMIVNLVEGRIPFTGGTGADGLELAVPGAILFSLAGMAFSTVITFILRGRRLSELNWIRFGFGGGLVSFFFLPILISVLRFLSGDDMLGFQKLMSTGALGLVFGSVAAAGTLKMAQLAERYFPDKRAKAPELLEGDRSAPSMEQHAERSARRTGPSN